LTELSLARSGRNQAGPFTNSLAFVGGNDYVGSFSLLVETPEPSTYLLFGADSLLSRDYAAVDKRKK